MVLPSKVIVPESDGVSPKRLFTNCLDNSAYTLDSKLRKNLAKVEFSF